MKLRQPTSGLVKRVAVDHKSTAHPSPGSARTWAAVTITKEEMMDRVQELEREVKALETQVGSLEEDAADLEVERDDLKNSLSVSVAKVCYLEGEVERITAQKNEANQRIEKLWKKKDEEVVELQGRLDRAMEAIVKKGEVMIRGTKR